MLLAARAEFLQLKALWIIPPVLHGRVIPLFALGAREVNYHPDIFFLGHDRSSSQFVL
jgi:hypothetical protein